MRRATAISWPTRRLPSLARRPWPARRISTAAAPSLEAAAGDAVAAAASLGVVPQALAYAHVATGLPWWLAIGGSAVALRVAILPSVFLQVRESRRFFALRPQLLKMRTQFDAVTDPGERALALLGGMRRVCREAGVRPWLIVGLPLVQIPALFGLVWSERQMLLPGSPLAAELREGGAAWFADLTAPDATLALPLLSLAVLVANLQLSMAGDPARALSILSIVRNVLQAGSVVFFPFVAELPSGVFMYLLPNSTFSLLQSSLLRASARRAAGAPATAGRAAPLARSAAASPASAPPAAPHQHQPAAAVGSSAAASAAAPAAQSAEEQEWRRRLASNADDTEAHVALSKALLRQGRAEEAVAQLWPAVKAAPVEASGPLRFQLALALASRGQFDVAAPLLEQVLQLEPQFAEALLALTNCQAELGKLGAAMASLERVAQLRPEAREWCEREIEQLRGRLPEEE